jgi:hypothetical protein
MNYANDTRPSLIIAELKKDALVDFAALHGQYQQCQAVFQDKDESQERACLH